MMGAAGLQCALCHHVRFLWNESEKFDNEPGCPEIRQAVTLVDGTALCAGHVESYDRSRAREELAGRAVCGVAGPVGYYDNSPAGYL